MQNLLNRKAPSKPRGTCAPDLSLPGYDYSHKLISMNTQTSEAPMATTKKADKPQKKVIHDELTFLDVRQAARDGQKAFDKFVITGKLPITK
ncbi:hypothetical protein LOY64_07985 [Pseudomonas corrugata]|uniref:Uncharacterized protein n=2 Tax=Pseudomonas corrugata TaxID=47879 RepID=A0A8B6UZ34_9PSED|nr:hypothetical protein [Pseudomonas corrugata]MDU9025257.1 hypothetical protein [Pseudomonas corrugata]MDU9036755.1 hypothetical protein [Pseudomonas corrugata]MDU9040862.1 hypothetical protein [Pseudomonas corrugata]QTH17161.1 hypothetical protein C4C32_07710 [Pseudomonas corrugata]UZD98454.1 hypothetical protein LOY64_07985 [Pseudomonas corrugata]